MLYVWTLFLLLQWLWFYQKSEFVSSGVTDNFKYFSPYAASMTMSWMSGKGDKDKVLDGWRRQRRLRAVSSERYNSSTVVYMIRLCQVSVQYSKKRVRTFELLTRSRVLDYFRPTISIWPQAFFVCRFSETASAAPRVIVNLRQYWEHMAALGRIIIERNNRLEAIESGQSKPGKRYQRYTCNISYSPTFV